MVNNLINESHHLKQRILFEEVPSGQRFLTPIIEAMRDGYTITIEYRQFDDYPYRVEIEPYCVKVFRPRWYVLGRRPYDGAMRVYALGRIVDLKLTESKFNLPKNFDAYEFFSESIGVIWDNHKTEWVYVKVMHGQQNYLRTLPLHHSQTEKEMCDDYSIFSFYGASVEVLSPQWLRDTFQKMLSILLKNIKLWIIKPRNPSWKRLLRSSGRAAMWMNVLNVYKKIKKTRTFEFG